MALLNLSSELPFSAWNDWPASSKPTITTLPAGPGPLSPLRSTVPFFASGKIET